MKYQVATKMGQIDYNTMAEAIAVWERLTKAKASKDLFRALKADCAHRQGEIVIRPIIEEEAPAIDLMSVARDPNYCRQYEA